MILTRLRLVTIEPPAIRPSAPDPARVLGVAHLSVT